MPHLVEPVIPVGLLQVHPKTKIADQDELSSLLQVPLVVSHGHHFHCSASNYTRELTHYTLTSKLGLTELRRYKH